MQFSLICLSACLWRLIIFPGSMVCVICPYLHCTWNCASYINSSHLFLLSILSALCKMQNILMSHGVSRYRILWHNVSLAHAHKLTRKKERLHFPPYVYVFVIRYLPSSVWHQPERCCWHGILEQAFAVWLH